MQSLLNSINYTNQELTRQLDSAMDTIANLTGQFDILSGNNASELVQIAIVLYHFQWLVPKAPNKDMVCLTIYY